MATERKMVKNRISQLRQPLDEEHHNLGSIKLIPYNRTNIEIFILIEFHRLAQLI